jgi:hypothetical protein
MCNSIKQNWLIEELRWDLLPSSVIPWDGLTKAYPNILPLVGDADADYHRVWISTLNALHRSALLVVESGRDD